MSFREKGKENEKYPAALPVCSVDTIEEAQALQVYCCKLVYVDEPEIGLVIMQDDNMRLTGPPFNPVRMRSNFVSKYKIMRESGFREGDLDSIVPAGDYLESIYTTIIRKDKS